MGRARVQTGRREETEADLAVGVPSHPVPQQSVDAPFPVFTTLAHR